MAKKKEKRYGCWAGFPEGHAERLTDCVEEVQDDSSRLFRQCSRKRGHGDKGLYCKQHAKKYVSFNDVIK